MSTPGSYDTHLPSLQAAIALTSGPVLELGMGDGSTPYLNESCAKKGRLVISVDTNPEWWNRYLPLASDNHQMHLIGKKTWAKEPGDVRVIAAWDDWPIPNGISVSLIDCAPGEVRTTLALRLRERSKFLVCHDFEEIDRSTPCGSNYGWAKILPYFKFCYIDKTIRPWTAVLSDFEEFKP